MKKIKNITQKSWLLMLALIFLCSCYEIVYISQESDTQTVSPIKIKVCINLLKNVGQSETPYFGMLLPNGWKVEDDIPYYYLLDMQSIEAGLMQHSAKLSNKMQIIDPAPKGYCWWVGRSNQKIHNPGMYLVLPKINSGNIKGSYAIDYMIGDSYHGLDFVRSGKQHLTIVDQNTPTKLQAKAVNQAIELNWLTPKNTDHLAGYILYRDGKRLSEELVSENGFIDYNPGSGSHTYNIQSVYLDGPDGLTSAPTKICYAHQGPSIHFDGHKDKVIIFDHPSLHLNHSLTLEAWIKPENSTANAPRIISKGVNGSGYELYLINSNSELFLKFDSKVGSLTSKTVIIPENWYHVAISYNGMEMKLYINGEVDVSKAYAPNLNTSKVPLLIGRSSTIMDNYFQGNIDNVRIWSVARTPDEIKTSFSKNLTDDETGLVGNWNMQEGCSYFTCDLSNQGNTGFIAKCNWCATEFPFVQETNATINPNLKVPVMNYNVVNNRPDLIKLIFKINPDIIKFEGIDLSHTQLQNFGDVETSYGPNGTIRISAANINHSAMQGDVLLYINLKALQPEVYTTLNFYTYISDGVANRTQSASITATDVAKYKTKPLTTPMLKDVSKSFEAKVFPNPARYSVTVNIKNSIQPVYIMITNILGQAVYADILSGTQKDYNYKINTSEFEKGVYFINLNHGNEVSVKKLAIH